MININTEKCEKCVHNDICKNTGYIDRLIELHKMIEYKGEFCDLNINLMCEYYKDAKSAAPISWPANVRGIEVLDAASPL